MLCADTQWGMQQRPNDPIQTSRSPGSASKSWENDLNVLSMRSNEKDPSFLQAGESMKVCNAFSAQIAKLKVD